MTFYVLPWYFPDDLFLLAVLVTQGLSRVLSFTSSSASHTLKPKARMWTMWGLPLLVLAYEDYKTKLHYPQTGGNTPSTTAPNPQAECDTSPHIV